MLRRLLHQVSLWHGELLLRQLWRRGGSHHVSRIGAGHHRIGLAGLLSPPTSHHGHHPWHGCHVRSASSAGVHAHRGRHGAWWRVHEADATHGQGRGIPHADPRSRPNHAPMRLRMKVGLGLGLKLRRGSLLGLLQLLLELPQLFLLRSQFLLQRARPERTA